MTLEKVNSFSYGVRELETLDSSTEFQRKIMPKDDCLFYVVAIFYQTRPDAQNQERGGNRGEFIVKGQDLIYKMSPQIKSLSCGNINFCK